MSKNAALISAIKAQNIRKVAELLNDDNINLPDEDGKTPLYYAAKHGRLEICKLLIENGATESINLPKKYGYTPLYWAAWTGHLEICKLLIENGATESINSPDEDGKTPLYWAAKHGRLEICKLLIHNGANCKDIALRPKLFEALEGDAAATLAVKILNQNGTLPDGIEITPEDLLLQAVIMGAEVVFDKIVAENNDILSMDDAEHLDALNQILTEMGYHSAHTMQDALNLFIAASAIKKETLADHVVDIILEHSQDIDYNNAFVTAIMSDCLSIAQQIFDHGVDLNAKVGDITVWQHLNIYQIIDEALYDAIYQTLQDQATIKYSEHSHRYSSETADMMTQLLELKQVATEATLQLAQGDESVPPIGADTIHAGAGWGAGPANDIEAH